MPAIIYELKPYPDAADVARRLAHRKHLLWFDSALRHPQHGRWSHIMADPVRFRTGKKFQEVESWMHQSELGERLLACAGKTFQEVESWMQGLPSSQSQPPPWAKHGISSGKAGIFTSGIAGLLGYDLNRSLERIPPPAHSDFITPNFALGYYEWSILFDHELEQAWYVDPMGDEARLASILEDLQAAPRPLVSSASPQLAREEFYHQHQLSEAPIASNFSKSEFLNALQRAIDYIHAGDVFQVNLAQRLLAPMRDHPLAFYFRLRQCSPASFAAYFDAGDFQIASASPEQFLELTLDGQITTRPIKGTRPRGQTAEEDAAIMAELAASPKDRAENVMIVDLLRNDLGRVARYGTVHVPRICQFESYRTVHHLVSVVCGRLREGLTALDLLRAAFPGGSVTGAPKVRAMEIIAELEPTPRGPYCGSMIWVDNSGTMNSSILIRTATIQGGWAAFPVGSGIVADSEPENEYAETLHKAAGFLQAIRHP